MTNRKKNESMNPDLSEVAVNVWNKRFVATENDEPTMPPDEFVHGLRSVDYQQQGLFTVALVTVENWYTGGKQKTYAGVAKRNPEDRNVPIRGKALALTRALDTIFTDMMVADLEEELSADRKAKERYVELVESTESSKKKGAGTLAHG